MKNSTMSVRQAIVAAMLSCGAGATMAADDVAMLQARLAQMEQQMAAMKAELSKMTADAPAQVQQVQAIETRVAKVEQAAPTAPKVIGNRVFFRGGYTSMTDDRANGAFTDMNDISGALGAAGLPSVKNGKDDGWYFGAGFDFLLSRDTLGLLPGTWALAELGLEFRNLGSEEVPDVAINADDLMTIETYASDAVPVFVGHYWLTGTPKPLATNVACTDYSVAKGGKLVAYRWDGESNLREENFYWIRD